MSNFRSLLIWQKSMALTTKIYFSTNKISKRRNLWINFTN